jgi:NADH dehydrogenase FAD-containing subunit
MKHLLMLGAGHAHLHLLSTLGAQGLAGVQITLVTPSPNPLYSGRVPGFVAGRYPLEDCTIALAPLLKNAAINWLQRSACGLDATTRTVTLDDGGTLHYDVLSINNGPVQDRQQIEVLLPGAREHALFVRPLEVFAALWPRVVALAQSKPLRVALIGGGATGFELACAVAHRLPGCSVTLLSGDAPVVANYPSSVQAMVMQALKTRRITVLQERCVGIAAGEVTLASGARLACDVPIIAIGAQAPTWLQDSGLALDAQGYVAVDCFQRSTSHPQVFAAAEADAVRAGPALTRNLRAVLAGVAPKASMPQGKTLQLLSCGDQRAIAHWGNWSAQGRWLGWLKDWLDRGFVQKYRRS